MHRVIPHRALAACLATALLLLVDPAGAGAQDIGAASVRPDEGGSSTPFAVRIPDGATCPGDSANDGYRVNSYMVPGAVDPIDITFDGLGPTPPAYGDHATFREPLFDLETNSYVSAQTADASAPGEPGPIINVPMFSFAVYAPGDVPPGRYHVGLACTLLNEIVSVWDAEVLVTAASNDDPAGIRWRVVSDGASSQASPGLPVAVVAALAAFVLVTVVRRRRLRPPATSARERT